MNILHISNVLGKYGGGVSEVVKSLIKKQLHLGHSIGAMFLGKESDLKYLKDYFADRKPYLKSINLFSILSIFEYYDFKSRISNVELIHQHGIFLPVSFFTLFASFKKKIVISPHGYLEPEKMKVSTFKKKLALLAFENKNLEKAACIIACSRQEAIALKDFGIKQPIAIIPNAVDDDFIARDIRKKTSNHKILLYLGRIHPFKGLKLLICAIKIVQHEFRANNWTFVIAGNNEDGYEEELKKFVYKESLEDLIKFVGPKFSEEKIDIYDSASCYFLPSRGENFGITVLEALARGLPVITTKLTPWEEIEKAKCGWQVSYSEDAFVDVLTKLLATNEQGLASMGRNSLELANSKYSWSKVAGQLDHLYKWVLSDFQSELKIGFEIYE